MGVEYKSSAFTGKSPDELAHSSASSSTTSHHTASNNTSSTSTSSETVPSDTTSRGNSPDLPQKNNVHPLGNPGPFQIIDNHNIVNSDQPINPPRRRYSCPNYETCLDLAAALNWDNFTCRGCSGDINQALYWRASQAIKKDRLVRSICDLPSMKECKLENAAPPPHLLKIAGKG